MSEMVELVARILEPKAWAALGGGDSIEYQSRRTSSARKARAAIAAMREPTEAMIDRFVSRALCVSVSGQGGWSQYARDQWQTMIDAALSEQP